MFILRDLLTPLQEEFSNTEQGQKRKVWSGYTESAVLHFYGEYNSAMERIVASHVGNNSFTCHTRTNYCCTG